MKVEELKNTCYSPVYWGLKGLNIKLIKPDVLCDDSISSAETFKIQQLNLPLLAAYTPSGHNITIVDESFVPDDPSDDVDLVGITVLTEVALRAYQIASAYRQRGVRVVLGGIHTTALPEEALKHADAVVLGEGEEAWPQLVSDAERGNLSRIYRSNGLADIKGRPHSRHEDYPHPAHKGYLPYAVGLETSRGCPFRCEFCSVGLVMGHKYRTRPVQEVISEIDHLDPPAIMFVDDNLALNRKEAKKLFTEMTPLKCRWVGEGSVSLAEDIELLRLMKRSGCKALLIGFESIQKEAQDHFMKIKGLKVDYSEAMRRFHGEGIAILGSFIFGLDHENIDVFDQTLEFALRSRIELGILRSLTPYPGTALYQRLLKEDRLTDRAWWLKDGRPELPLFRPLRMKPDEFLEGLERISKNFYSISSIIQRFFGIPPWKRSPVGWHLYTGANMAFRKRYYHSLLS